MKHFMRKTISCFYLFIVFPLSPVFAQYVENVSKVGTTSAPFLNIPIGSRACSWVSTSGRYKIFGFPF